MVPRLKEPPSSCRETSAPRLGLARRARREYDFVHAYDYPPTCSTASSSESLREEKRLDLLKQFKQGSAMEWTDIKKAERRFWSCLIQPERICVGDWRVES